ncbi:MAG: DUF4249 domain-containing protein [Cytophagia bacterium]|nr:DUF4249 domain-containing protein [Cytophagia bacterium]
MISLNNIILKSFKRELDFCKRKVLYLFIVGLINASCFSNTEIELPEADPFLVINATNFQNDSTWLIEVSKSNSISDSNKYVTINDAQVIIKDEDGAEINLAPVTLSNRTFYTSNIKPSANKTYEITVMAPGFPIAKASSKLPEPVSISKVEIDSTYIKELQLKIKEDPNYPVDFSRSVYCQVTFSDPKDQQNFYDITGHFEFTATKTNEAGEIVYKKQVRALALTDENGGIINLLTDDTKFNGAVYKLNFFIPIAFFLSEIDKFYISLHTVSREYFNYKYTFDLQNTASVDPFSQPVIVFGNIKNGAGLFAGFSTSVWTLNRE